MPFQHFQAIIYRSVQCYQCMTQLWLKSREGLTLTSARTEPGFEKTHMAIQRPLQSWTSKTIHKMFNGCKVDYSACYYTKINGSQVSTCSSLCNNGFSFRLLAKKKKINICTVTIFFQLFAHKITLNNLLYQPASFTYFFNLNFLSSCRENQIQLDVLEGM